MSHLVQILRCFLSSQEIIIINVDRLVCMGIGFSYQHIKKSFIIEKISNGVILAGIKNDKTVYLSAARHGLDHLKDFFFTFTCDHGVDILPLVAQLADPADGFQIKGVFVCLSGGNRQNDPDGTGILGSQIAGLEVGLIS